MASISPIGGLPYRDVDNREACLAHPVSLFFIPPLFPVVSGDQAEANRRPMALPSASLRSVVVTCLLLTWANPHVYLDTVALIGSIAAQYDPYRLEFGIGAASGSFVFFTALGYGARLLAPVFQRPRAWVVLEVIVGAVMWAIALTLVLGG
jgi:arginine exporter protein ArgO